MGRVSPLGDGKSARRSCRGADLADVLAAVSTMSFDARVFRVLRVLKR